MTEPSARALTLMEWARRIDPTGETSRRLAEMVDEFERKRLLNPSKES